MLRYNSVRNTSFLILSMLLLLYGCSGDNGDMTVVEELEYSPSVLGIDWDNDQSVDCYDLDFNLVIDDDVNFFIGVPASLWIIGYDHNGDTMFYAFSGAAPVWSVFDAVEANMINCNPVAGDEGAYSFMIEISDNTGLSSTMTVTGNVVNTIEVEGLDTTGDAVADIADADDDDIADTAWDDLKVDEVGYARIVATSIAGDPITYTLIGAPAWVDFDPSFKTILILSPVAGDDGPYSFTIQVSLGGVTDTFQVHGTVAP